MKRISKRTLLVLALAAVVISAHAEIDEFIAFVRAGAEIIEVF